MIWGHGAFFWAVVRWNKNAVFFDFFKEKRYIMQREGKGGRVPDLSSQNPGNPGSKMPESRLLLTRNSDLCRFMRWRKSRASKKWWIFKIPYWISKSQRANPELKRQNPGKLFTPGFLPLSPSMQTSSCRCNCRVSAWVGGSSGSWPEVIENAVTAHWVYEIFEDYVSLIPNQFSESRYIQYSLRNDDS